MQREPGTMSIEQLRRQFVDIEFPEYQREPNIWSREQKQRLIDSILRQFDVASIYLYRRDDGSLECIDGRQRLNAIMSFLGANPADEADNGFSLRIENEISAEMTDRFEELNGWTFDDLESADDTLATEARQTFMDYRLTVVYLSGVEEADEFNLQFLRLNLGTLINAGEKLNAMVGGMRQVVFEHLGPHRFLEHVSVPTRRFAREQIAAQILLQIFARSEEEGEFARARHLDLQKFFKVHSDITLEDERVRSAQRTLDALGEYGQMLGPLLRNRAMTVSLVLVAWENSLYENRESLRSFVDFAQAFMGRLQYQVGKMKEFDPDDRYAHLVDFQRHLTQASVEKPAVARRHELLTMEWHKWLADGELTGDAQYKQERGEDPPAAPL